MRDPYSQQPGRHLLTLSVLAVLIALSTCVGAERAEARPADAQKAYVDAYIEGLVELGVLTRQQADQLRARAEAAAQEAAKAAPPKEKEKKEWFDKTKVGGYIQVRWNDHVDKDGSLGDPENDFQVRRARIKVESKPTDRLKTTLQVDLPVGDGEVTVKDAYADVYLGDRNEGRLRVGQAKVPFGFQIPQSSSRRLTLERADIKALTPGERDRGVWLFYTPQRLHERFEELKKHHLGTGDWGLFAAGLYQGQGFNTSEANDDKHFVFRFDYPFETRSGRLGQVGLSVLTGDFVSGGEEVTVAAGGKNGPITATVPAASVGEHALNFHFYLPPDPWGVQFEWLEGESAALFKPDPGDPRTWSVGKGDVDGWYGQFHYKPCDDGTLFVRYDEMDGFKKKGFGDLPSLNDLQRLSFGYAHQIDAKTEFTIQYDDVERNGEGEDFLGVQMQYKY